MQHEIVVLYYGRFGGLRRNSGNIEQPCGGPVVQIIGPAAAQIAVLKPYDRVGSAAILDLLPGILGTGIIQSYTERALHALRCQFVDYLGDIRFRAVYARPALSWSCSRVPC